MVATSIATLIVGMNFLQTVNQRLDHALYPGHEPKLVVAGRIVDTVVGAPHVEPAAKAMRFRVERVVQGDPAQEGQVLDVPVASFGWPKALVPFTSGTPCLLVMSRTPRDRLETVVPVVYPARVPRARDGANLIRILAHEILGVLAVEHQPRRQRELILQAAPILTAAEAEALAPYLGASDPWLRRAALAGLVYATESPTYLCTAATDVEQFYASTGEDDLIDGIEPGVRYAAIPFFQRHYFFLEGRSWRFGSRWDEAEAARNLRLYRALLAQGKISAATARRIDPDGAGGK